MICDGPDLYKQNAIVQELHVTSSGDLSFNANDKQ